MTVTLKVAPQRERALRELLAGNDFAFSQPAHTFWQGRGEGAVVSFYTSGKVVVQGKEADRWAGIVEAAADGTVHRRAAAPARSAGAAASVGGAPFAAGIAMLPEPKPNAWVGIDETGKGDYFGPLVVVAARVEVAQLPLLAELGVDDSKKLTDKRALAIAADLEKVVPYRSMVLMPTKYNELYARIGNLNQLLAWAHAATAEDVLEVADAELILSDQFSKANLVERRLKERGRQCRYQQRTKAEDDPAVGAASILARAVFVRRMAQLSESFGIELPKGAGPPVLAAARRIVAERGPEALGDVAKLHFRTTQQAGG